MTSTTLTLAMTHASYIFTAWIVSVLAIGAYCGRLVQRGRRLSRAVPAEHRRWMTSDTTDGPTRR
jgi:hypothetical protein